MTVSFGTNHVLCSLRAEKKSVVCDAKVAFGNEKNNTVIDKCNKKKTEKRALNMTEQKST